MRLMPATRSAAFCVAAGMRRVFLADAAGRIAAQRHDVAHAGVAIAPGSPRRSRAWSRRRRSDAPPASARSRPRCAAPSRACARASSRRRRRSPRRNSAPAARAARSPPRDSSPSPRSSAERTRTRRGSAAAITPPRGRRWRSRTRGSRASQSDTAILPSEPGSGDRLRCSVTSRPAARHPLRHRLGAKPRRRWACSSRRNSRSCGAKSTTSSRPPGASTRAASRIARAPSSRKCST